MRSRTAGWSSAFTALFRVFPSSLAMSPPHGILLPENGGPVPVSVSDVPTLLETYLGPGGHKSIPVRLCLWGDLKPLASNWASAEQYLRSKTESVESDHGCSSPLSEPQCTYLDGAALQIQRRGWSYADWKDLALPLRLDATLYYNDKPGSMNVFCDAGVKQNSYATMILFARSQNYQDLIEGVFGNCVILSANESGRGWTDAQSRELCLFLDLCNSAFQGFNLDEETFVAEHSKDVRHRKRSRGRRTRSRSRRPKNESIQ